MLIDPCTDLDRPGWLLLRRQLWPDSSDDAQQREIETRLAEPDRYAQWLARDLDGEPQGLIEVSKRRDPVKGTEHLPLLFLDSLFVQPAARRQGLARHLVATAAAWGSSHSCHEFASDAALADTDSQALHRALGFEETERAVFFRRWLVSGSSDKTLLPPPASRELKAFVPALDFALAKRFYMALGMDLIWSTDELAYFRQGPARFLLQTFKQPDFAAHFQMHLLVDDADAWWRHAAAVAQRFGTRCDAPEDRAWGMRDFVLVDPSGVLWRIGHPLIGHG